ncbi:MAG: toll/interleukin-1 receptor domain-containing protein [Planctomycetaceae bacterium]
MSGIFLSHNTNDKDFVRKLSLDLEAHGVKTWLDEAEIKVGESLIEKIRLGIDEMEYLAVILSPDSVASPWVQREVDVAMNQEIYNRRVKVLPLMYKRCDLPGFLLGKKYADFSEGKNYVDAFRELLRSIGIVFNKSVFERNSSSLFDSTNRAIESNLRILSRPFHRPFQYLGMTVDRAATEVGGTPNEVGNIIVENDDCRMLLEAEGNFITFIDLELKRTAPHYQNQVFDPEAILGSVSINPAELSLDRSQTFSYVYSDHRNRIQIMVLCAYDTAPISIGFSTKYYGT